MYSCKLIYGDFHKALASMSFFILSATDWPQLDHNLWSHWYLPFAAFEILGLAGVQEVESSAFKAGRD